MTLPRVSDLPHRLICFGFACLIKTLFANHATAVEHAFFHENVLGTSLELHIVAEDTPAATRAEEIFLREIDRLSAIYSQYDPNSEFSILVKTP